MLGRISYINTSGGIYNSDVGLLYIIIMFSSEGDNGGIYRGQVKTVRYTYQANRHKAGLR